MHTSDAAGHGALRVGTDDGGDVYTTTVAVAPGASGVEGAEKLRPIGGALSRLAISVHVGEVVGHKSLGARELKAHRRARCRHRCEDVVQVGRPWVTVGVAKRANAAN
jgi:hypothetical protein